MEGGASLSLSGGGGPYWRSLSYSMEMWVDDFGRGRGVDNVDGTPPFSLSFVSMDSIDPLFLEISGNGQC